MKKLMFGLVALFCAAGIAAAAGRGKGNSLSGSGGNVNVNVDLAPSIEAINDAIPEAVYYVTAYYMNSDGEVTRTHTTTVSSAAEAKTKKDEYLLDPYVLKVHIESKYPTIYRDCNDDWYYD